jgi:hypothetical protein
MTIAQAREICTCIKNRAFFTEKPYKVDPNGILKLKQGGFKDRYKTGALYCALPNGIVATKPAQVPVKDKKFRQKTKTMPELGEGVPVKETEKRTYKLNKRKLRSRILVYTDCMRRSRRWKHKDLYFWTISFPKGTSDDQCYQLLNTWLTALRQRNRYRDPLLHSYLWVAERQEIGTIHFHIMIPHFLNVKVANRTMMVSICNLIKKKELNYPMAAARRYNGVDIAKNRKTKKVVNFLEKKKTRSLHRYLTKYISKNNTEMPRLCWNSSVDWAVPFAGVYLTREELVDLVPYREMIKARVFENDYIQFWAWTSDPPKKLTNHLCDINTFILADYFSHNGKKGIFLN